jgi:hypothetical protein
MTRNGKTFKQQQQSFVTHGSESVWDMYVGVIFTEENQV